MTKIIRTFIENVLLERSFDTRAYDFAKQLTNDIVDTIGNAKLKPFKFSARDGNLTGFYTSLGGLGILVPTQFKNLQIGIAAYEDAQVDTRALYITDPKKLGQDKILITPGKISTNKDPALQASQAFHRYKKYLFHEIIHYFELYVLNDKSRQAEFDKQMDKLHVSNGDTEKTNRTYYSSQHELNAYLHQAFYELMEELDIINKSKQEAETAIPNIHVLWDELTEHTPHSWDKNLGDIKLRKMFASRIWELWQSQLEKLSNE